MENRIQLDKDREAQCTDMICMGPKAGRRYKGDCEKFSDELVNRFQICLASSKHFYDVDDSSPEFGAFRFGYGRRAFSESLIALEKAFEILDQEEQEATSK